MRKIYYYVLLVLPILVTACGTKDFNTNSDYREIAIIYGLLDIQAPKQFVKVNLAFQNANGENAITLAKDDPLIAQYEDSIIVELNAYDNKGALKQSEPMTKEYVDSKQPGDFNTNGNYWYTIDTSSLKIIGSYIYEVQVTNTITGKIYKAETDIVNSFCITSPSLFPRCVNTGPPGVNFYNSKGPKDVTVKFNTDENAGVYKIYVEFYYDEFYNNDITTTETKVVSYAINSNLFAQQNITDEAETIMSGESFVKALEIAIDTTNQDPSVKRSPGDLIFTVVAGGKKVTEYIRAEDAYSAITQTRPFFTNVFDENGEQGAGVLSSRYFQTKLGVPSSTSMDRLKLDYPGFKF